MCGLLLHTLPCEQTLGRHYRISMLLRTSINLRLLVCVFVGIGYFLCLLAGEDGRCHPMRYCFMYHQHQACMSECSSLWLMYNMDGTAHLAEGDERFCDVGLELGGRLSFSVLS